VDLPEAVEDRDPVKEKSMTYLSNYMPEELFETLFTSKEEKKNEIQFRDSSNIQIERKPCGCMANKVKQPESS
jgi:hypothetical protein